MKGQYFDALFWAVYLQHFDAAQDLINRGAIPGLYGLKGERATLLNLVYQMWFQGVCVKKPIPLTSSFMDMLLERKLCDINAPAVRFLKFYYL
jgi:hypothetical protein